jgi:carboxyl-terminal processing protease
VQLTSAEQCFILAKVFQSIPLHFAHWDDALIAVDQLDAAFQRLVAETQAGGHSRRCFSLATMAFLARLNNGHTRFVDPWLTETLALGMELRPLEGRWTVVASVAPGLRAGDVLLAIEGESVEAWYARLTPYLVGSPQSRTAQFGEANAVFQPLLGAFLSERYTVTFEDAQGVARDLVVDRGALETATSDFATHGRWLSESVAYLKVPSFLDPACEARALAYLRESAGAARLIIDVRGNGGGSTPSDLIRALMDRPYRSWAVCSDGATTPQLLPAMAADPDGYQGRVVLLVDRGTYSAAEDFTMPFKDNGRAILIGEVTGGSTGQPYYYTFDCSAMLGIGAKRVRLPDGTPFEGVGLAPDVIVTPARGELYAGRDPVLEAALVA